MIIVDLPYLATISHLQDVTGGTNNKSYDNRAVALANSYANGLESVAAAGTLVFIDRGFSEAISFSEAQSSS